MNEYENLKVGQIWVPDDKDDFTLQILDVDEFNAEVKQLEGGDIFLHEMEGSDSFPDYLEQNNYHLKQ
jgi:hypothetical protein